MNLADEVKNIKDNGHVQERYASAVRVAEKYNDLLSRGLIKEEDRRVSAYAEITNFYARKDLYTAN